MATLKSGRYVIPEQWNTATMGVWVIGKDTTTGKDVFIKEFRGKRYVENPGNYENLKRANERTDAYRKLMERINGAVRQIAGNGGDVVVTTDFFREGLFLYKVNEKVDFLTWKPWEVHKHLSVDEIDVLMLRLVNAIAALHGANLLHCDLKPENVFIVQRDGTYVGMVSDFDDSFFMDELPQKEDVIGTPEYMSPELGVYKLGDAEQPNEELPLGPASDLFAIGLIYHMYLTGEMPRFDTDTYSNQLFGAMLDDAEYELSGKLDAAHHVMIQRLLIPSPLWRINSCAALVQEISNIRKHRNKEYRLTLMDGERPLSNRKVTLYGTYSISNGAESDEITEALQEVQTDKKGNVSLKGIPPEMRLFVERGDSLSPILWKESNNVRECVISVSNPPLFSIRVLCDNKPLSGTKVTLFRKNSGKVQRLSQQTTDAEGKVTYSNLPDDNYLVGCGGVTLRVKWDDNRISEFPLKTYCLKVTKGNQPVVGKPLSLFLYTNAGKRKVKDGVTDNKGEFRFRFAVNRKKWFVSCEEQEEEFIWTADGAHEMQLDTGVKLILTAQLLNSSTPVQGVGFVIARKTQEGKSERIREMLTDVKGQATMEIFEPGVYYFGVTSTPDGYTPCNIQLKHLRKLTLSEGSTHKSVKIPFQKEFAAPEPDNIVSTEEIPESLSTDWHWRQLLRYKDGSVVLVNANGSFKKLPNDRSLPLYGLDSYRKA